MGHLSECLRDAEIVVAGLGYNRFVDAAEEQFGNMQFACASGSKRAGM